MRRYVAALTAVLLVVGAAGAPPAAGMPGATVAATEPTPAFPQVAADEIRMTTTLDRTPDRVGSVSATVSFRFPDRVTELTARLPDGATVTDTDGFSRETATDYEWDERTDRPSVTFRVDTDRLSDREGPIAEEGRYLFTETDEWALVRLPSIGTQWVQTGERKLAVVRETAVDGPGVAGDRMAFLGPHAVETHTAHGQTFRLVIPEAAALEPSVEEVFRSLSRASDRLRVGDRDREVLVIAAPTGAVDWGVRGLQTGDAELWVQDSERLDTPTNVWVHEYVHTRQEFRNRTTAETRWLTEATATYYAALLTLEENRIEFAAFRRALELGASPPQSTSTLSRPESWQDDANYGKGSLVVGDTDRRIRDATDSEASFETVFRSLNSHADADSRAQENPVTAADLEAYIAAAGTDAVATESARYIATEATPAMWDSRTHGEVFGQLPARFSFGLAADDPIRVSAGNDSRSLNGTAGTLTVGETLTVDVVAENVGGTVGDYELPFQVNGTQTTATGRLAPNETASHQFTHTFAEPGRYTVTVADERIDVRVEEAEPTTEGLPVAVETPGFGISVAVASLLLSGLLARRRQ